LNEYFFKIFVYKEILKNCLNVKASVPLSFLGHSRLWGVLSNEGGYNL